MGRKTLYILITIFNYNVLTEVLKAHTQNICGFSIFLMEDIIDWSRTWNRFENSNQSQIYWYSTSIDFYYLSRLVVLFGHHSLQILLMLMIKKNNFTYSKIKGVNQLTP